MVANRLVDRHRGQWLRVTGVVHDVEGSFGIGSVILNRTESQPAIKLEFDMDAHGVVLGSLNVGDKFAAIGKISDILSNMVFLIDCELNES